MAEIFNVLIVGAGNIGAFFDSPKSDEILTHAHGFSIVSGFKIAGFVDVDIKKAERASAIWGGSAFTSLEEAFDSHNIDIVSICTPDEFHCETLRKLSNFPIKLVFAEKPLTKSSTEAEEIIKLYKEKNISCLVNYSRRFVKEFKTIKSDYSSGIYGKFICGTGYYGKGILHNGSHLLDFLRYLIGEIKTVRPIAYSYDYYKDDPSLSCILTFKDSGTFSMLNLPCKNYTIFEIELLFEKCRINIVDSGFKIEMYRITDNVIFEGYRNLEKYKEYNSELRYSMKNAVVNIYNHLTVQDKLNCTMEDSYEVIKICESLKGGINYE